jgi:hypothetical protein
VYPGKLLDELLVYMARKRPKNTFLCVKWDFKVATNLMANKLKAMVHACAFRVELYNLRTRAKSRQMVFSVTLLL